MRSISKRFGELLALDSVDLQIESGTVHALVGENGAGKTTLMRILFGAIQADSGAILINESTVHFTNSKQAIANGVAMVSQHTAIIPELTCLQNLILGAEGGRLIERKPLGKRAESLAAQMGFRFDWHAPAATLSPSGGQKLEILKLLWRKAQIMVLDEPTAMLSPADSEALFASLKALAANGSTVILVTHRLSEVTAHCDSVSVLRGGRKVASGNVADFSLERLASLVIGEGQSVSETRAAPTGGVLLSVSGVSVKGFRGNTAVNPVSFDLHAGELAGIAGVDGNGQRELLSALMGELPLEEGEITWNNRGVSRESVRRRIEAGFRLIPEDRLEEAIVEAWSLEENSALGLQLSPPFARMGLIAKRARREAAESICTRFSVQKRRLRDPIASLSGGNQQRFVAGRALFADPRLILAFQPCRGLDIRAAAAVYGAFHEHCSQGACALVISFDLDEVMEHCSPIFVMSRGSLHRVGPGEESDRKAIGRLMTQ